MIFVVLGTQKFQFNRLLKKIDQLIESGVIAEEVFAQVGHSDYVPRHYKYTAFLDKSTFEKYIGESDILLSHSGVGTIISGLKLGKPVVVVPRLAKHGEHIDDHQVEIAESFQTLNYILMCGEEDDLAQRLEECRTHKFQPYVSHRRKMIETVQDYLSKI